MSQYDVIIVGAGISGIGTAYWLQKKCPGKKFCVLEARESLGGTWSLFKYPGIRSDSDMFTFGYRFKPWSNPQSLSSGQSILNYLDDTVRQFGLGKYIRYGHRMKSADWSDASSTWVLGVQTPEGMKQMETKFLSICTGYYDYKNAYRPPFKGEKTFKGEIILPQFWPENTEVRDNKFVVVGSGATAVTLVPALAEQGAGHVTMLQRSPTYIMTLPNRNGLFLNLKKVLPLQAAYKIARWKNILLQMGSFGFSKAFPKRMKGFIMKTAARQLPKGFPVEKHFSPKYNPWDQRLCVVPDGDLFRVIREGRASVVTDTISHFTSNGIVLDSGETLEADAIVLATGLNIQLLGGAQIKINGEPADMKDRMIYKGMLVSGIPNLIYAFGYTNASWTLKVDLTANYLCKILNYMDRRSYDVVVPATDATISEEDFLNLSSGYIQRAKEVLPKQGAKRPWKVYQNYLVDMLSTRFGGVSDRFLKYR